jgi:hopanoid C-3 methylase
MNRTGAIQQSSWNQARPNEMKFLAVHPSCLMYSKICLWLEPLGLELVATAAERAGHSARLIDLQCESHQDYFRSIDVFGRE